MPSSNVLKNVRVSSETINLLERQRRLVGVGADGLPLGSFEQPVYSEAQMQAAQEALQTQISRLREEAGAARQLGYQEGLEKGRSAERAHLRDKVERMEQLAGDMLAERSRILSGASQDVVRLAIRLAERFCRQAQTQDPHLALQGAKEALEAFGGGERVVIRVHPSDLELVREQRQELGRLLDEDSDLQLRADESVAPGGCVVETPQLHIDGSIEGFLDRCAESLGHWAQREDLLIEDEDAEHAA